jgi:hypothetical protein
MEAIGMYHQDKRYAAQADSHDNRGDDRDGADSELEHTPEPESLEGDDQDFLGIGSQFNYR